MVTRLASKGHGKGPEFDSQLGQELIGEISVRCRFTSVFSPAVAFTYLNNGRDSEST